MDSGNRGQTAAGARKWQVKSGHAESVPSFLVRQAGRLRKPVLPSGWQAADRSNWTLRRPETFFTGGQAAYAKATAPRAASGTDRDVGSGRQWHISTRRARHSIADASTGKGRGRGKRPRPLWCYLQSSRVTEWCRLPRAWASRSCRSCSRTSACSSGRRSFLVHHAVVGLGAVDPALDLGRDGEVGPADRGDVARGRDGRGGVVGAGQEPRRAPGGAGQPVIVGRPASRPTASGRGSRRRWACRRRPL